jgi:putative transposase
MDSDRVFFVTTVTLQRFPIFRREATAELLIHTLSHYRDAGKFLLHEFVIMPDHVHVLLTPAQEISLERAMQFIKGGFSFRMKERGFISQPSFTNHRIRDWEDYERHRDYVLMNPVRARLPHVPTRHPARLSSELSHHCPTQFVPGNVFAPCSTINQCRSVLCQPASTSCNTLLC